ncbi:LysR family transcriptional regulator [Roseobacter sp. YSTF-M11]|uniref:LysR family transcriptional regulator n=1 Tax=Roseobacter insulae TaxID=2859783 RepID=A0A9X1K066_9RHOB|nr:LysR substrate-binding domain-containing protein [Roseobacter insulae]MBW4709965.1 LysR family transcriptional regulator [Roseobacter insulae]
MSLPPLTWFRAFDAAARHLSFTLAAEELGFTQSAISQHVRSLEDRLGTQLFVRRHRALMLTDAGRLLVPDVAAAMGRLTQATERFQPTLTKPKLTIATSASVAQWIIAPRLASFHKRYPDSALQIVTTVWPDDFSATNADIEIRFGSKDVVGQGAELLTPSRLHVVASPSLAERLGDPVDWSALQSMPLIQPIGLSTGWADVARRAPGGQPPLEASILVDTHGLAVDLAVSGAGVALTHTLISQTALCENRLHCVPLDPCTAEEGYYLARKATSFPREQDAFVAWFHDSLALLQAA